MDVYFFEAFEEETRQLQACLNQSFSAQFTWKTIQEAEYSEPPAPIISIRTQSRIPLQWAAQLKAVLTRSTGYDHMTAYRRASSQSIPAGYLPCYCHRAVAEQAMLLWTALLRQLPRQMAQLPHFQRDGLTGRECQNKTLLVVGAGRIGCDIIKIARALDMNVLAVDIDPRHDHIDYIDLETGLSRADIIVCAMSLNSGNHGYFNYDRWQQTKKGAIFINIARGEMAPTADLIRALDQGFLAGVGLDVYDREASIAPALRANTSNPDLILFNQLRAHPNVICTPHNAFNTIESIERKSRQSIQQLQHFIQEGRFIWPVP